MKYFESPRLVYGPWLVFKSNLKPLNINAKHLYLYFQEDLLSLRKLPTEAQIEEVRRQRYERAEKQIQMERERMERQRGKMEELAGPSAARVESNQDDDDNPLLEQMNIIREYIKEARKELKFEEVSFYLYFSMHSMGVPRFWARVGQSDFFI